jgi:hypothetical protein
MIAPPMWPGFASDAGHRRLHDQALEHQAEGAKDNRSRMRGGDEGREVHEKRIRARPARQRQKNKGHSVVAKRNEGTVAEI